MNTSIFKAYDIRGMYPKDVNPPIAHKIGIGLGKFFGKGRVVVARDGRIGSPELYRAVIDGLQRANRKAQIVKIGLATTPMFYFLVQRLGAVGGVIVTASHNPREYNGFKVVGRDAEMMSGKEILKILNKKS